MNPITKGHVAMINFAKEQGSDVFVYLSHSQDSEKNPLPYDRKIY
jgi:glycerol-3-phosphate cytidylyltransferase-like family protein